MLKAEARVKGNCWFIVISESCFPSNPEETRLSSLSCEKGRPQNHSLAQHLETQEGPFL